MIFDSSFRARAKPARPQSTAPVCNFEQIAGTIRAKLREIKTLGGRRLETFP